jgi:hypothetical protein
MSDSTGIDHDGTTMPRRSFLRIAGSALAAGVAAPMFSRSAAGQQASSATDFLNGVGVGIHLPQKQTAYFTNFGRVIELIKDIGITHLRDDATFASYVSRDHDFYKRVRILVALGYRFDLVCADPLNEYMFVPSRKLQDIYDWCDQGIEIFEGANEPNLVKKPNMNPAISAEHQRALFAAVKANAKMRNIIVAAPSYILKNVAIAEDLSDAVDWINLHPYPGMENPETRGPSALNGFISGAERIFGKKPVLVSETGYHTALQTTKSFLPVSESIKTRYLPRLLLWNFMNGVKRTYIYELMDSFDRGLADPDSHFGLADFTGNPKASFAGLKQFLALFRRASAKPGAGQELKFNLTGNVENHLTAVFKRDDGSHLLFLWLGISGWDNATRTALSPVTRNCTLVLSSEPREIMCHQFRDDGSVVRKQLSRVAGAFEITISDQLTALEIVS